MSQGSESTPLSRDESDLSARDHFLHIEAVDPQDRPPVPDPIKAVDEFLAPYEEGFLADSNYYRERPELLLMIGKDGILGHGNINHLQFRSDADRNSFWTIEMDLTEANSTKLWVPTHVAFVRLDLNNHNLNLVNHQWINTYGFLFPNNGTYEYPNYDRHKLNPGIFSYISITTFGMGKIYYVHSQGEDYSTGAHITRQIRLARGAHAEPRSSSSPSPTLRLLEEVLGGLPIRVTQHTPPPVK